MKVKMKDFPESKYKIFVDEKNRKVIAVSTYAGKRIKGVAVTNPEDTFDFEKGKKLAITRCAEKIARRRKVRAKEKFDEAILLLDEARLHYTKMYNYFNDATDAVESEQAKLASLIDEMK